MKCSSCGAEASGSFCSSCGNSLQTNKCGGCGALVPQGARFCTSCGKPLEIERKAAGGGPSVAAQPGSETNGNLAWWVAGALLVVVFLILGYPVLSRNANPGGAGGSPAPPPGMGVTASGAAPVDLTTMPVEEQAMDLFDRVMRSAAAGDTAGVAFFLPMALGVHEQIDPVDADGIFHFTLLYLTGEDFESALAKAKEGLDQVPDHLLLLGASGEAAVGLGDSDAAREYYGHYLDVYETEMGLMRSGYEHHQPLFPVYLEEARAFLDRG